MNTEKTCTDTSAVPSGEVDALPPTPPVGCPCGWVYSQRTRQEPPVTREPARGGVVNARSAGKTPLLPWVRGCPACRQPRAMSARLPAGPAAEAEAIVVPPELPTVLREFVYAFMKVSGNWCMGCVPRAARAMGAREGLALACAGWCGCVRGEGAGSASHASTNGELWYHVLLLLGRCPAAAPRQQMPKPPAHAH